MKCGADFLVNVNKTRPQRGGYSLGTATPWCLIPQKGTAAPSSSSRPDEQRGTPENPLFAEHLGSAPEREVTCFFCTLANI